MVDYSIQICGFCTALLQICSVVNNMWFFVHSAKIAKFAKNIWEPVTEKCHHFRSSNG